MSAPEEDVSVLEASANDMDVDLKLVSNDKKVTEVSGLPTFDLNTYINAYRGEVKVLRVEALAAVCRPLRERVLELAITLVRNESKQTKKYKSLCEQLAKVNSRNELSNVDSDWVQSTQKANEAKSTQLETELSRYADGRTQTRPVGDIFEEYSNHSREMGLYTDAQRFLRKQQDSQLQGLNDIKFSVKHALLSLFGEDYSYVKTICQKVFSESCEEGEKLDMIKIGLLYAISLIKVGEFEGAATILLKLPAEFELLSQVNDIATTKDIGVYVALCALSTFNRTNLKFLVDKDPIFALFIEEAGYIGEMISHFLKVNYTEFFRIWSEHQSDFQVDCFLSTSFVQLKSKIFDRAMTQYLQTFSSIYIDQMASDFLTTAEALIVELERLVFDKKLNIRIDSRNGIISLKQQADSSDLYEKSLELAKNFAADSRVLLMSMEALKLL